ncbi:hypothetical protein [uncultured Amaricoccus sp.]|uniref:hypothetical protein n=1 Tax=uncultured Amaricoccus sp. TaxID=339341 RepID=UPI0034599B75
MLDLIGIAAAVGTGLLLKNTVMKSEASPFIMELPPCHLPTARTRPTRRSRRPGGRSRRSSRRWA